MGTQSSKITMFAHESNFDDVITYKYLKNMDYPNLLEYNISVVDDNKNYLRSIFDMSLLSKGNNNSGLRSHIVYDLYDIIDEDSVNVTIDIFLSNKTFFILEIIRELIEDEKLNVSNINVYLIIKSTDNSTELYKELYQFQETTDSYNIDCIINEFTCNSSYYTNHHDALTLQETSDDLYKKLIIYSKTLNSDVINNIKKQIAKDIDLMRSLNIDNYLSDILDIINKYDANNYLLLSKDLLSIVYMIEDVSEETAPLDNILKDMKNHYINCINILNNNFIYLPLDSIISVLLAENELDKHFAYMSHNVDLTIAKNKPTCSCIEVMHYIENDKIDILNKIDDIVYEVIDV
jgi:hypothetical protein